MQGQPRNAVNHAFCSDCRVIWQWLWAVPIRACRCPMCWGKLHSRQHELPGKPSPAIKRRNATWPRYQCGSLDVQRHELN